MDCTLRVGDFVLTDEVTRVDWSINREQVFRMVQVSSFEGVEESVAQLFLS